MVLKDPFVMKPLKRAICQDVYFKRPIYPRACHKAIKHVFWGWSEGFHARIVNVTHKASPNWILIRKEQIDHYTPIIDENCNKKKIVCIYEMHANYYFKISSFDFICLHLWTFTSVYFTLVNPKKKLQLQNHNALRIWSLIVDQSYFMYFLKCKKHLIF